MNAIKTLGILLIVLGTLGASYGGFSYTKQTEAASIGPIKLQVTEQQRVNIPLWAGLGAVGVGLLLLLTGSRKT